MNTYEKSNFETQFTRQSYPFLDKYYNERIFKHTKIEFKDLYPEQIDVIKKSFGYAVFKLVERVKYLFRLLRRLHYWPHP